MTFGMQMLAIAGGPRITLSNANPQALVSDPSDATAVYQLTNAGVINRIINGATTSLGNWMTPQISALAGNYDVRATLQSGSLTSGTTGSSQNLGTTRSWNRSQTTVGASSATLLIEIFRAGTTSPTLASCTVTLDAEVT